MLDVCNWKLPIDPWSKHMPELSFWEHMHEFRPYFDFWNLCCWKLLCNCCECLYQLCGWKLCYVIWILCVFDVCCGILSIIDRRNKLPNLFIRAVLC